MNWKIMGFGMALSLPLIYFLARGFDLDPRDLPEARTGGPAPAFSLPSIEGYKVSLEDLKGSPVVINFWSTWCVPCVQEHKDLLEVSEQYKSKGVAFLGMLYADTKSKAKVHLARHGSAYPTLIDENQRSAIDYGVSGVPETFVIDSQGVVVKKIKGPIDKLELSRILDGLL